MKKLIIIFVCITLCIKISAQNDLLSLDLQGPVKYVKMSCYDHIHEDEYGITTMEYFPLLYYSDFRNSWKVVREISFDQYGYRIRETTTYGNQYDRGISTYKIRKTPYGKGWKVYESYLHQPEQGSPIDMSYVSTYNSLGQLIKQVRDEYVYEFYYTRDKLTKVVEKILWESIPPKHHEHLFTYDNNILVGYEEYRIDKNGNRELRVSHNISSRTTSKGRKETYKYKEETYWGTTSSTVEIDYIHDDYGNWIKAQVYYNGRTYGRIERTIVYW